MKRYPVILSILLFMGIVSIIFSLYVTRQSLKEISKEERKLETQNISYQPSASRAVPGQKAALKAKRHPEAKEPEFDLSGIPDNDITQKDIGDIEERESQEAGALGDRKLNKQPDLRGLKELKAKGIIIY